MEIHDVKKIAPSQGLRLMAIHAHPDDESSKGAATMAAYVDAGAEVMVVSCTGGERGDILNAAAGELARQRLLAAPPPREGAQHEPRQHQRQGQRAGPRGRRRRGAGT